MALDIDKIEITTDPECKFFLREAYSYGMRNSDDPDSKTGVLILNNDSLYKVYGANRLPNGVEKTPERLKRPEIYKWIRHAERDAITKSAKAGYSLENAIMYLPWFPCNVCAQDIEGAGIKQVIGHKEMIERGNGDGYGFEEAYSILEESGILMLMYDGKIGNIESKFRGKIWNP